MHRRLFICLLGNTLRKPIQSDRQRSFRQYIKEHNTVNEIKQFITENTEIVRGDNLTPEISLRLFTVKCRFWTERAELWPFADPFWAIYWPGGQALTRYLLNNPELTVGRKVLDLGCGCGASAIAAKLNGAAHVVANNTDPIAAIATKMNCELNSLEPLSCVTENLICSDPDNWDLVLLGDMFYDETLTDSLHKWLYKCFKLHRTQILIEDPGRAQFESHFIRTLLYEQARFDLPHSVREENFGLTSSTVWCYRPD